MRLGVDEITFFGIFIAFNLYMIGVVEGIIAKLFFVYWAVSIAAFAVYIIATRDKKEDKH